MTKDQEIESLKRVCKIKDERITVLYETAELVKQNNQSILIVASCASFLAGMIFILFLQFIK